MESPHSLIADVQAMDDWELIRERQLIIRELGRLQVQLAIINDERQQRAKEGA